ncbi:MAG: hypothetical protein J0M02_07070 [Planctomycetes bacterium]|nr:hypothetical protein [Planctomycetota bacterium]
MSPGITVLMLAAAVVGVVGIAAVADDHQPVTTTVTERGQPHPVEIRRHPAPRVRTGAVDHACLPATIACSTCHAVRTPDPSNKVGSDLDQFHQGLQFQHGSNTCLSCHDPGSYDHLRRSDGQRLAFEDSIELCSQCHGPQRRDYDNGAHGGMNGYWDLQRGGRVRNTCIDCHDPHVPKYQGAIPMPHARDRFQQGASHD